MAYIQNSSPLEESTAEMIEIDPEHEEEFVHWLRPPRSPLSPDPGSQASASDHDVCHDGENR
jgi:hypothetical protein